MPFGMTPPLPHCRSYLLVDSRCPATTEVINCARVFVPPTQDPMQVISGGPRRALGCPKPTATHRASTTATLFTPLQARYRRPSRVATIFRTVPPPEGMASLPNASVLGSKRTSVFGLTPDSL